MAQSPTEAEKDIYTFNASSPSLNAPFSTADNALSWRKLCMNGDGRSETH